MTIGHHGAKGRGGKGAREMLRGHGGRRSGSTRDLLLTWRLITQ